MTKQRNAELPDDELISDLRRIVRREQLETPIAEVLKRCVDGWIVTAARMAVLA